MKFDVRLLAHAERDLDDAYLWAAKRAPQTAALWARRFEQALTTLATNPLRCGKAPEHRKLRKDVRQFLFGRKPNVFRAVFVIEGNQVRILRVGRTARRPFTRKELESE